ncbi:hypothetical protein DRE_01915 [Drechslerella stenobrocha 248]|uniref:Uncharacterized protein n=1 Tax=Drechslerella stenobrocha 248 TaxID=1043628 RepID=W7I8Q9_9PEZI|nr:hypothetical protein DRE_01915 [Drechslerella stenobrocha 248]
MDRPSQARPMSAAARAAVMRAKMAGMKLPRSSTTASSSSEPAQPTYLIALEKFTTAADKWLVDIEHLREVALKHQKRGRACDPASSHERVHKTPFHKIAARKTQAEDVVMKGGPHKDGDSGKSVSSNDRIRPTTPTKLPKLSEPSEPRESSAQGHTPIYPASPPARKFDEMDIQSPPEYIPNIADAMETDPAFPQTVLPLPEISVKEIVPAVAATTQTTANTSTASVQPLPPPSISPITPAGDITPSTNQPVSALGSPAVTAPTSASEPYLKIDAGVKLTDALPTSSTKKRRLSSKTILESLMEKKAANPIWYDGTVQKLFHDIVFEMSHQIQSVKREARIVMFAKDPTCRNVLVNIDNMLQKSLRVIEVASFLFLKGRSDLSQVEALCADLKASRAEVVEFQKSGWSMAANDDEDSDSYDEDDDDEGDSDDGPK